MGRDRYRVIKGVEYASRRHEPGDVVNDVPKEAVSWLIECGAIAPETTPDQGKRRQIGSKPRSSGPEGQGVGE